MGRKSNQVQPLDAPSWISHPLPSPLPLLPSSKALESSSFPWAQFHRRRVALLPAAHQGFLLPSHTSWSSSEHGGISELHAPCFHPIFFSPHTWINLEAELPFSALLKGFPFTHCHNPKIHPGVLSEPSAPRWLRIKGFVYTEAFNQDLECFLPQEVNTESRFYGLKGMGENRTGCQSYLRM